MVIVKILGVEEAFAVNHSYQTVQKRLYDGQLFVSLTMVNGQYMTLNKGAIESVIDTKEIQVAKKDKKE